MKSLAGTFLEESIFGQYFNENVSEISFNGSEVYINYINQPRAKLELEFDSDSAYDFVRHIADLTGKNFNNTTPILDVSFDNYRINAIHSSVASCNNEGAITFIIRLIYPSFRIKKDDPQLCNIKVHHLLAKIIKDNHSIMISGVTGAGKSELQKYLISLIPKYHRIVMIEDTYETHIKELISDLDINIWIAKSVPLSYRENLQKLIKAGLRNNPDWLMISEVRGNEMVDLLQTVSSGISIITTIHAQSALDTPGRMLMLLTEASHLNLEHLATEIYSHIHIYIHLRKSYSPKGLINRYISEIAVANIVNNQKVLYLIYANDDEGNQFFDGLDETTAKLLKVKERWYEGKY